MIKKLKNIQTPLKVLISLGIFAVVFSRLDIGELKNIINQVEPIYWAFAIILTLIQFFLLSLRWEILINVGRTRMTYLQSLQTTLASLLANTLFIAAISGMAIKIALALNYGASLFKSILATIVDRIMTLFALGVFAVIFLPALSAYIDNETYKNTAIFLGVAGLVGAVFTPLILLFIMDKVSKSKNTKLKTNSAIRYLSIFINNRKTLFKVITISLIAQLMFFFAIYLLSLSAGIGLSFLQLMTILPIISLVASLPISIGGWGVREGAFVFGLGLLGISQESAFLISVQIGLISLLTIILAGFPAIMNERYFETMKKSLFRK